MKSRFHPEKKNKCIAHVHFGEMWDTLPERVKNYICDLEQRADPSGEIQTIASLTEQRDGLVERVRELEDEIELLGYEMRERAERLED